MKVKSLSLATVPLAFLVLLFLSFGLLIPWLGFYWDDWPAIMVARLQGAGGFWDFYHIDRPFSAWTMFLTVPILGARPLAWHVFTLSLRWATVLGMWSSLRLLWPKRSQAVTWIALLFAVYPVFDLQPVSVAFSQHWITYTLFFMSIAAMLRSQRHPHEYRTWLVVGLASQVLHLFTMEYFAGLELLRPLLLWIVLGDLMPLHSEDKLTGGRFNLRVTSLPGFRQRLLLVLRRWLPYLIVLSGYLLYRLVFLQLPDDDPYRAVLLANLFQQPLAGAKHFLELVIPDMLFTLFGAWYQTIDPSRLPLNQPFVLFSLGVGILVAVLGAFYLQKLGVRDEDDDWHWYRQAFVLGILVLLIGPLPVWITGKNAVGGLYNSRFALASLLGASLLFVGFLEWLRAGRAQKALLVAVLLGLAAGQHLRTANDFRWSWTKQSNFYWQLHWRAPSLQPGTILLSDGEIFPYVGVNSTAAALNMLYPLPENEAEPTNLSYWFSDLYRGFGPNNVDDLAAGLPVQRQLRSFWYNGSSRDSLVIFYEPEGGRCLWVLSPDDGDNPELPDITSMSLPASNLNLIGSQPSPGFPPPNIFGPEPERGWCYYYQKAGLARQMGDWDAVVALGDEAIAKGFTPNNVQEWLPFIEAFAYAGRWQQALDRSLHLWRVDRDLSPRLCRLWRNVETRSTVPSNQLPNLDQLKERMECDR